MTSLWTRVEPLLARVRKPARYIGCEDGAIEPRHGPGKVAWKYRIHQRQRHHRRLVNDDNVVCQWAIVTMTESNSPALHTEQTMDGRRPELPISHNQHPFRQYYHRWSH